MEVAVKSASFQLMLDYGNQRHFNMSSWKGNGKDQWLRCCHHKPCTSLETPDCWSEEKRSREAIRKKIYLSISICLSLCLCRLDLVGMPLLVWWIPRLRRLRSLSVRARSSELRPAELGRMRRWEPRVSQVGQLLMAFRLMEASSSLWPPERKVTPESAGSP